MPSFRCLALALAFVAPLAAQSPAPSAVLGFPDFAPQAALEQKFLAVPSAELAGQHLKTLTAEPHIASSPADLRTAEYVAAQFRAAGLDTQIIPYRVLMNQPKVVKVDVLDPDGKVVLSGPTPEHVDDDAFQSNPNVVMPFNGSSGSGDLTSEVVYANYGRLEDFDKLAAAHIDLHGKIVLVRYGQNFRGVKVFIAEQRGAAAVLIYSDPKDDGFTRGAVYPHGPWRPETGVQRGSVQFMFNYPGDPETPGTASTLDLPDAARLSPKDVSSQPHIPSIPLSWHDAQPILRALSGTAVPPEWQGGLPFAYHLGPGGVRVHIVSQQDFQRRTIWNVIGTLKGSALPDQWVVCGNHRDAWVYGAVDPSSGTAAMLETVHGIGQLVHSGWRPRRTLIFASWDAEEEGLIGSTEWVEQNIRQMPQTVAYFNTDVAVSGGRFGAEAVPSLKQFLRELTRAVPSPDGGTVYDQWLKRAAEHHDKAPTEPPVGDLGSGSDFSAFLQHAGVPSTDIGSGGSYGVYHSVFDNYAWFVQNADPHFVYLQQMARIFGLEALRMAQAPILPLDYVAYATEIDEYLATAQARPAASSIDFAPARAAASRLLTAARIIHQQQLAPAADPTALNHALRQAETDLLLNAGLPNRPWFRHAIYAPGQYTGYAAVVLPGVNEALDSTHADIARQQLQSLTEAINRAAATLESAGK